MRERRLQKGLVAIILLICLIVGGATNALADTIIQSVRITVRKNQEFRYPTIEVPSNSKYKITNQTGWSKAEADLIGGDEIYCTITITPNEGYKFYLTESISVSGATRENVRREGENYKIDIYYTVDGKLQAPQNPSWDYGIARCEEVPNATGYEFQLLKNNVVYGSVRWNDEPEWNFTGDLMNMSKGDKVKFKVRAINDNGSVTKRSSYATSYNFAEWSELWWQNDYDDWWDDDYYPEYNGTPESYYRRNPSIYTTAGETGGYWEGSTNNWRYHFADGRYASGWVVYQRQWYYIVSGGRMASGWMPIGGKWYYLSPTKTSNYKEGAMYVGWNKIDGKWYYFYEDGRMAANTRIDNSHLGEEGNWIGDW